MTTIAFPDGIPGLPPHTSYDLTRSNEEAVFMRLTSGEASLPVVLPWVFHWDFQLSLKDEQLDALEIEEPSDLAVLCVVNVKDDMRRGTINLFAPIVINERTMTAKQLVNGHGGYSTRDPLFKSPSDPIPVAMHGLDFATLTGRSTCE